MTRRTLAALLLAAGPLRADPPAPLPVRPPTPPTPEAAARREALSRFGAALLQEKRDRLVDAAKNLETAAKLDPAAAEPLRALVPVYAAAGREPDAVRAARKVLALDPHDYDTAHTLGRLLFEAGEFADAAAALQQAADSPRLLDRPERAVPVLRDLGRARRKAGDRPAAEAAFRAAAKLLAADRAKLLASGRYSAGQADDDLADTWEEVGTECEAQRKFDAAAGAFREAHRLFADATRANDPAGAARLSWNLSGVYAAAGQPHVALAHLDDFLRHRPAAAEPYQRLAALLRQASRGGEVVPKLRALAARSPANRPLARVLAVELGRDPNARGEADRRFADLLASDPADPDAARAYVRHLIDTGRPGDLLARLNAAYTRADPRGEDDGPADGVKPDQNSADRARALADALRAEPSAVAPLLRKAVEDLRAGVRHESRTWHLLGLLAVRHRELGLAEELLRRATVGAPRTTEAEAYSGLIRVLWLARKPAEVAAVCRAGARAAEFTSRVLFDFHLALALAETGDADAALAAADAAIRAAGANDGLAVRLRKATVLRVVGRTGESVALCRDALANCDTPADRTRARYALAGALWADGKRAESEAELRLILADDPDHAAACNDLGYHLADQGRELDEAERLVRHAVAVDRADRKRAGDPEPENAAYLDSLGWVLFRRGKHADARDWLERAADTPDGAADAVVWDHLGDVCFRLGDKPRAKVYWEKAAELYVNDPRGKREGRTDEVRKKLRLAP